MRATTIAYDTWETCLDAVPPRSELERHGALPANLSQRQHTLRLAGLAYGAGARQESSITKTKEALEKPPPPDPKTDAVWPDVVQATTTTGQSPAQQRGPWAELRRVEAADKQVPRRSSLRKQPRAAVKPPAPPAPPPKVQGSADTQTLLGQLVRSEVERALRKLLDKSKGGGGG